MLALASVAVVSGCGGDQPSAPPGDEGVKTGDPGPIHVHGLGINPKDGALFVATHTGLFRAAKNEKTAKRVADRLGTVKRSDNDGRDWSVRSRP